MAKPSELVRRAIEDHWLGLVKPRGAAASTFNRRFLISTPMKIEA
jgi:hypothetical protein